MAIIEPKLSPTAKKIAQKRYLRTDMEGKIVETPGEMLARVARHMAKAEINWPSYAKAAEGKGDVELNGHKVEYWSEKFYERMVNFKFVCAGKAMFEAGNPGGSGQLSSCFVLPVEDNIDSIFKTLGDAAVVHKNNGGTGFNFSKIRPRGDKVKNVPGSASGPVDFLAAYSAALSKILQGAKRQGANIGILNADHPDIIDFITLKDEDGTIKNFNVSVGVTDEFMKAVRDDKMWSLINPRTQEVVRKMKARRLFRMIVDHAWATGDPGLMFLTRVNRDNPTPTLGQIEATNPCGEITLLPYESCNLTSICIHRHLQEKDGKYAIDWRDLERSVRLGVRFLDNMIEVNTYSLPEIEQMVKRGNRRIGLGVMGFAHTLVLLRIPYNCDVAVDLAEKLAEFIRRHAEDESRHLAEARGSFPNWDISIYAGKHPMRNCATTMIAPTGTTAMLADTTSGIEPIFSLVTKRKTFFEGDRKNRPTEELYMVDSIFEMEFRKFISENSENFENRNVGKSEDQPPDVRRGQNVRNSLSPTLRLSDNPSIPSILKHVAEYGLKSVEGLPDWFYKIFVTTHEIYPQWHVKIQAAWQKYFDNSISKTVNFPHDATPDDVTDAYMLAWKLGCKGITIYRDGSKRDQVLNLARSITGITSTTGTTSNAENEKSRISNGEVKIPARHVHAEAPPPGAGVKDICPECAAAIVFGNGCTTCHSCGWSKCSV